MTQFILLSELFSTGLIYLVIIVITIIVFLYLAKNTDDGKREIPKTGGSDNPYSDSADDYPDLGSELFDREERNNNSTTEDQTLLSGNIHSGWETATFSPKIAQESSEVKVSNISKYTGSKYTKINNKMISDYLAKQPVDKFIPDGKIHKGDCIAKTDIYKAIARELRDSNISPYSFYTDMNNSELANSIGISVASLNKYFKNTASVKLTADINEFFKTNIKDFILNK